MSARVALLQLQAKGFIELPAPRNSNGNGKAWQPTLRLEPPPQPLQAKLSALGPIQLQIVSTPEQSQLWNALVAHYHYLGHCNLPGAQLRYLIYALDFSARYGWRPVLLETFVQEPYPGTGYGAAQWIHLGQTRGRGKKGPHPKDGQTPVPVKHLWVYPLAADFRHALCIQEPWK